jgi:hypothetical protein
MVLQDLVKKKIVLQLTPFIFSLFLIINYLDNQIIHPNSLSV